MKVIPAVNCPDSESALNQIRLAGGFSDWIHLDVADGGFTPNRTWGSPEGLSAAENEFPRLSFEVHLMVQEVESILAGWLASRAKRLIVQWEGVKDKNRMIDYLGRSGSEKEIGVSLAPQTSLEEIKPYLPKIKFFQILAVSPGLAGQSFNYSCLEKIKSLRSLIPGDKLIEVDGGADLRAGKLIKDAHADILVSASFIFGNPNPKEAYEALSKI